jgi:hypothetical protein
MRRLFAICVLAGVTGATATVAAWESETTHAGLTERAALHADLHAHLRDHLGMDLGLFMPLIVPPADAPDLFRVLAALDPTHGYVPDASGRMLALAWLSVGSVLADVPVAHAAHHFFDPTTGRGLGDRTLDFGERLGHRLRARAMGAELARSGKPAPDWLTDPGNPLALEPFLAQYEKAVSAPTPGERRRHLAAALMAAGGMLHVLQDMGSPAHVRNDLAAHLELIGTDRFDRGSRFERIAALVYGRLGVPAPGAEHVARVADMRPTSLRAFFTTPEGTGLADRTARHWFSPYTLPGPVRVHAGMGSTQIVERIRQSLDHPAPVPPRRLDLEAARTGSARAVDDAGVCLASYRLDQRSRLRWFLDDACMNQQVAAILPEVAAYSAAFLDWLMRGTLALEKADDGVTATIAAGGAALGAGTLTLFWDDDRGARTVLGAPVSITAGAIGQPLASVPAPPAGARSIAAVFRGLDSAGEPVVAVGYRALR